MAYDRRHYGSDNFTGRDFTIHMFEEDIQKMGKWVLKHPHNETGGDLFGLWTTGAGPGLEPVIHVVLGPGDGCRRTSVSFFQSIPYLKKVGYLLTQKYMLGHIGEWHSHHQLGLFQPSGGDSSTVTNNYPRGAYGFILIIVNIVHGGVKISPYLYSEGSSRYKVGRVEPIAGESPFRAKPLDVREAIRSGAERDSHIVPHSVSSYDSLVGYRRSPSPVRRFASSKDDRITLKLEQDTTRPTVRVGPSSSPVTASRGPEASRRPFGEQFSTVCNVPRRPQHVPHSTTVAAGTSRGSKDLYSDGVATSIRNNVTQPSDADLHEDSDESMPSAPDEDESSREGVKNPVGAQEQAGASLWYPDNSTEGRAPSPTAAKEDHESAAGRAEEGGVAPSSLSWRKEEETAAEEPGRGDNTALAAPGAPSASMKSPPQVSWMEARVPLHRAPLTRPSLGDRNLEGASIASRDPDSAKEKKKTSPTLPVHGSSTRAHGSGTAVRHTLPAISHYKVAGTGSSQARWESDKATSTRRSTTLPTSMRSADVESRVTEGQWYDTDKGKIAAKDMEERLKSKFGDEVKLERGKRRKDLTIEFKCHQEKWAIKFPSIFPDSKATLKGPRYDERVEMGPTTTKSFITQILAIVERHCSKCSRNQRKVSSRQSRSAKRECLPRQSTIEGRPAWRSWEKLSAA